jgi:SMC interacting uncharacterized protein involved in chromosome segregation
MENLSGYTPTQLLKMINDCKAKHETLKHEIIGFVDEVETLEMKINARIDVLGKWEQEYVELIEELSNRENGIRETDITNE